jgi:hypothetical protein
MRVTHCSSVFTAKRLYLHSPGSPLRRTLGSRSNEAIYPERVGQEQPLLCNPFRVGAHGVTLPTQGARSATLGSGV